MFEQSLMDSSGRRTRTRYAFAGSALAQAAVIGVAVLVPLTYSRPLPLSNWISRAVVPWGPPPAKQRAAIQPKRNAARPRFEASALRQPTYIPRSVAVIQDELSDAAPALAALVDGIPGGLPGGMREGVVGLLPPSGLVLPPPQPRVEPPKQPAQRPINVHRSIQQAKLVYGPLPVYPPLARQQRVSGVVRLHAIIGKDGAVEQLKAVSGHPQLISAALEAVSKWRYRPTLLNDEPVEVITQIDVNFTLTQ